MGDFAVRQAGIALGKSLDDVFKYGNRSMGFMNVWDPNVTSDGFTGFAQRRFPVCTFFTVYVQLPVLNIVLEWNVRF